jgi:hypothetical protein
LSRQDLGSTQHSSSIPEARFPWVKQPWPEADYPRPPTAEVKNECSYTSAASQASRARTETFTFTVPI